MPRRRSALRDDTQAGLSVAAYLVPQALAYLRDHLPPKVPA